MLFQNVLQVTSLISKLSGRHEAFFKSKKDQSINGPDGKVFKMDVGEMVKIEESLKVWPTSYSLVEAVR